MFPRDLNGDAFVDYTIAAPGTPAGTDFAVDDAVAVVRKQALAVRQGDVDREIVALVAHGLSNEDIADRLTISRATVKTHVGRILAKLGLRDRAQVVVVAYESGLVTPGEGH